MQIIVTRTKCFVGASGTVTVSPAPGLQTVPDWVRDTETFKLGNQDGSLKAVVVEGLNVEPVEKEPPPPAGFQAPASPRRGRPPKNATAADDSSES